MANEWANRISKEESEELYRIIAKVPGFKEYLNQSKNSSNLSELAKEFMSVQNQFGHLSIAAKANLGVIINRFCDYSKESTVEKRENKEEFAGGRYSNSVLNWNRRPEWAKLMDEKEIDYLDHFLPQVPGLIDFLYRTPSRDNLNDLIDYYENQLEEKKEINDSIRFVLQTIRSTFSATMERHDQALRYINKNTSINDRELLQSYHEDASNNFYFLDFSQNNYRDFSKKYASSNNPYIYSDIANQFLNNHLFSDALVFLKTTSSYIFSSPNIYWNNPEAIYGCANGLYMLLRMIGDYGLTKLEEENFSRNLFVQNLFLLLTRVIHWADKEYTHKETYGEHEFPIGAQHKIQALNYRSKILIEYGINIPSEYNKQMMALSDLMSAHYLSIKHKVLGEDSVFKKEANAIFHLQNLYKKGDIDSIAEKGRIMTAAYSQSLYSQYRLGAYFIPQDKIATIFYKIKHSWTTPLNDVCSTTDANQLALSSPERHSYKKDAEEIRKHLEKHGIKYFYHFTDAAKLPSIIKNGGLLSYKSCLDKGISIPVRYDMAKSRDIDAKKNLEDYARVSFCKRLPKLYERQAESSDADFVLLYISTEVALLEGTLFTDKEATQDKFNSGGELKDLKQVNIQSTQKEYIPQKDDPEYWQYQSEVLVKGHIPLEYIININNPEKI